MIADIYKVTEQFETREVARKIEQEVNTFSFKYEEQFGALQSSMQSFIFIILHWIFVEGELEYKAWAFDKRNEKACELSSRFDVATMILKLGSSLRYNKKNVWDTQAREVVSVLLAEMHRTNKQSFTSFCFYCLDRINQEGIFFHTDLTNKDVGLDEKVVKTINELREERGERWWRLPMV